PAGWHTWRPLPGLRSSVTDPVTRIVAISAPFRFAERGCQVAAYAFPSSAVAVVVLEWISLGRNDRWRPRPARFTANTLPPHPPRRDHLRRLAVHVPRLRLDLAEDELPPAARDDVELAARQPDVRRQHAVAAQPVPPRRAPLGGVSRPRLVRRSSALRTSAGGSRTGRSRARPRCAPA